MNCRIPAPLRTGGGAITLLDLLDTDRSTVSAKEWATLPIAIGTGAGFEESQGGAL